MVTVIINKSGCHSISFIPNCNVEGEFLFRVIISEEGGYSSALFGRLNPLNKKITWVSYPAKNPESEKYLSLLLFLVAIAYRDIVVARDRLEKIKNKSQGKSTAMKERNSIDPGIVLIPRFKSGKIDQNFADPDKFIKSVSKIMPHIRSCHIRELPVGHRASYSQTEKAAVLGLFLPEGYTFVSSAIVGSDKMEQTDLRQEFRSLSLLQILFYE
jgi:hypothetical protein